jgi:hypothetical protein
MECSAPLYRSVRLPAFHADVLNSSSGSVSSRLCKWLGSCMWLRTKRQPVLTFKLYN